MLDGIRGRHLAGALTLIVASCQTGPSEPAATLFELSGTVELLSELGDPITPVEGVTVTATGEGEDRSVVADLDGAFRLTGLEPAEYALRFEKSGFGTVVASATAGEIRALEVALPARSSAAVTDVEVALDPGCGTDPCLDLTVRVPHGELFPEEGSRRFFRLFVRGGAEASPESFDRTLALLVASDAPTLEVESGVAVISFDDVRGLDLDGYDPGTALSVRVHGATENVEISYVDPVSGAARYPDLSEGWAGASVPLGPGET